jgi:hypothetical protein
MISMLWQHRWCSRCNLKRKWSTCVWDPTYATGVAYCWCHWWLEAQTHDGGHNCTTKDLQFHQGNMPMRMAYIADHLGLISLSPLAYYFIFMQATRYRVIHTRDSINQHHLRNSYTISLGWYYNSCDRFDCQLVVFKVPVDRLNPPWSVLILTLWWKSSTYKGRPSIPIPTISRQVYPCSLFLRFCCGTFAPISIGMGGTESSLGFRRYWGNFVLSRVSNNWSE